MEIRDLLDPKLILTDLKGETKQAVLREAAELIAAEHKLNADEIFQILVEREELGSTGIEEGLAIPHGKHRDVRDMVMCVARSTRGIDFESRDGKPTHLFVVLIAPENDAGKHLKALARVSRIFKQPQVRQALIEASDRDAIVSIISEEASKS